MHRAVVLALSILVATTCSSKSEVPATDVRIPLESVQIDQIDKLEEQLRQFGVENGFLTLENDRQQMAILNGGAPAITFWFLVEEGTRPAITATTVNQGYFLRVMFFSGGFNDENQRNAIENLFLQQFQD